ncbi:hypothetical protein [Actinocorallia herbida]|uniref:hypothetical protein n=1 Tax=Actinocorallia herbida TaxID=58109 RepID=UPI000F4CBFB1|nr:hypothetical protein [Actinocorallia herbida]
MAFAEDATGAGGFLGGFAPVAPRHHTSLVAFDVCAFGAGHRDESGRFALRRDMYAAVRAAFQRAGLPWDECHREDRGDGALVVLPPDVPLHLLLDPLAHGLAREVRAGNARLRDEARLRLRAAVHCGYLYRDDHGIVGHAVNHTFRLLNAGAFQNAMALTLTDVGLLASERLYQDVTAHGPDVDTACYEPVRLECKETRTTAWLWVREGTGRWAFGRPA